MSPAARRLGGHRDPERARSLFASPFRSRKPSHIKPKQRISIGALLLALVASGFVWVATQGESAWAGTVSLLPDNAVPRILSDDDAVPVELGMKFRVSSASDAVGVQFYKGPHNTGVHTATLWTAKGHHKLTTVTFKKESKTGLQQAQFNKRVTLQPHKLYVISYTTKVGRYSVDEHYFTRKISNGLITARRNAGVFSYRAGSFPTKTYAASNYAVDIVVKPRKRRNWYQPTTGLPPSATASATPTTSQSATPTPTPTPSSTPTTPSSTPTTTSATPTQTPTSPSTSTPTTPTSSTSTGSSGCATTTANVAGGPDGSGGCWPGTANTGVPASVKLKRVPEDVTTAAQAGGANTGWSYDSDTGSLRITAAGATISGLDVRGGILASTAKSNMTVEDTRFRCASIDDGNFCGALGSNSTMTDSEIGGGDSGTTFINSQGFWIGGSSSKTVLTRVEIHHIVHGLHVDGGASIVDSYLHDMPAGDVAGSNKGDAHTNCVFVSTGGNMTFSHSTFDKCGNNSGIFVQDYSATAEGIFNLTVEKSLFFPTNRNGQQSSYGVGIENKSIKGAGTIHVTNNVFGQGWEVGPIEAPTGADVTGNKYTNGNAVTVQWAK